MNDNTTGGTRTVGEILGHLHLGTPRRHADTVFVPVFAVHDAPDADWMTLDEALAAKSLVVEEISQQGSVPEIAARSTAEKHILIIDGEEFIGAKQNRILNITVLLAPKAVTRLPVSCVEAGRWQMRSARFGSGGKMAFHDLRKAKARSVTRSMRSGRAHTSNQGEVWERVSDKLAEMCCASPTSSMEDAYKRHEQTAEAFVEAFAPEPGQVGHIVFIHGVVEGFDILRTPQLYAKYHRKLVSGYSLRAPHNGLTPPGDDEVRDACLRFLGQACACPATEHPGVSCGRDLRAQSTEVQGSVLVHEGHVVFGEFFPAGVAGVEAIANSPRGAGARRWAREWPSPTPALLR